MKDGMEDFDRSEWKRLLETAGCVADAAEPSSGFTGRVMDAIMVNHRREAAAARRRGIWLSVAVGVAALLAVAVIPHAVFSRAPASHAVPTLADVSGDVDRLVALQQADGRWQAGPSQTAYDPAMTALALLAVSRHEPRRHAPAIARAVTALEALQREDGSFGGDDSSLLYNAAFATYALLEVARVGDGRITPAVERALAFSEAMQNAEGYWCDPARTVWQLGVLSKARELGWQDPHGALRRGLSWLRREAEGGLLDYRVALGRNPLPPSGGIVLTQLATESVTAALRRYGLPPALAGDLAASFDLASVRSGAPDGKDAYAIVVSLLASR